MAKVLVVDDEASIREFVAVTLRKNGFQTLSAMNGAEGLKLAKAHFPDLILCDVRMELMGGYEMLSLIREDPLTKSIPFILITAEQSRTSMRQGMELGADDYVTKPFTASELLAAVNGRLQKHYTVLEQAEQRLTELRSQLSTSLPHELRTPLNGIMGYADIMRKQFAELEPLEVAQMSERIYKNAKRLHRLVENFLIYAQLEILQTDREKITELTKNRVDDPAKMVDTIARQKTYEAARSNDLDLQLTNASLAISADYFTKIFEELFDNALRFSKKGTPIRVHSRMNGSHYVLEVGDEGRGMTLEQIRDIGAYRQFERKIYEQQGSGLGLVVAKSLVEVHGGTFSIDSEYGKYTTVTVAFPSVSKVAGPS
jgi:two-component system sensor histidine kinase/response regulator